MSIRTCPSFPDLIHEIGAARQRGARLVSAAPNPQLGEAVGFKLSDGTVLRLTNQKIIDFLTKMDEHQDLQPLVKLISTVENRIKLFHTC